MNDDIQRSAGEVVQARPAYQAPAVTYLGNLADLTQKTVGNIDGSTFIGLDIGSI